MPDGLWIDDGDELDFLTFGALGTPSPAFTLQLFHVADQEAAIPAIADAPRFSAVLAALRAEDVAADATVTLSSGDAFIPGVFASASAEVYGGVFRGDILIQNALGFDAISFGNHEFDLGTAVVRDLIRGDADFPGTAFPYLAGNLDFSTDANLADLVVPDGGAPLPNSITGSVVIERGGALIGVVSAVTPTIDRISSPGNVTIQPLPFDGDPTGDQLDALAAIIQADVDALLAANPGLQKVILLAHMQQLAIELALAERLTDVDIVVAGGSNTRLFDADDRPRDGDTVQGPYPIFTTGADGNPVAVVNTDGNYKYVGRLVIGFDENGVIIPETYDPLISGAYATDAEGVTSLGAEALIDPVVQAVVDDLATVIAARDGNFFGVTTVFLNGDRGSVRTQETNLGNLTADANLAAARAIDPTVVVSLKNGGGIRNDIGEVVVPPGATEPEFAPPAGNELAGRPEGGISEIAIQNALSFNNGLSILTLTRAELVAVLEHGVASSSLDDSVTPGQFPQVGGVAFSFDVTEEPGSRVQSAALIDDDGNPYEILVANGAVFGDPETPFRVVTLDFLANGGDGYPFGNRERLDFTLPDEAPRTGVATFAPDGSEQDALAEYLAANFPLESPFALADTGRDLDARIQNLSFRADGVFDGFPIVINEMVVSTVGPDTEFVEFLGAPNASLDDLVLLQVQSGGVIRSFIDFDGNTLGNNGYFVAASPTAEAQLGFEADLSFDNDTFVNQPHTFLLLRGFSGAAGLDLDTADDGILDVTPWDELLDSVAFIGTGSPLVYSPNVVGPDSLFLAPGGFRDPEGTGGFVMHSFADFSGYTPTPATRDDDGPGEPGISIDDEATLISAIQGPGDTSPLVGQTVVVEAIVTGDFQTGDGDELRQLGGFFLMQQPEDFDDDPLTSEGIFVAEGGPFLVDVAEGDRVRVLGTVVERFGRTVLEAREVRIEEEGAVADIAELAVPIALPALAEREAYESMLVRITEPLTFVESFDFEQFGEIRLASGGEIQTFTQVNAPSVEGFAAHEAMVADRTILLDDGLDGRRTDGAPILAPDGRAILPDGSFRMGMSTADDLVAIMDFGFSQWRLRLPEASAFELDPATNPRPELPDDVDGTLKVASFNVLNYFTTLNDGTATTAIGGAPRGATSADELDRQASKLVEAIVRMEVDVIGLIELENEFAPDPSDPFGIFAVQDLVNRINARLGVEAWDFVDPGTRFVGDDVIAVGFIYDTRTVSLAGEAAILDTDAFVAPLTPGNSMNRAAVAQTFEEVATGERFTAVVNHFKSKGSLSGAPDDANANDGQGNNNATRTLASLELAAWLATDPTGSNDPDFLILGDINAYALEDPIRVLEEAGYVSLGAEFGGLEAHSYRFSGQIGTLDYALANPSLAQQVTGATKWNINADEPVIFDYGLRSTFGVPVLRPDGLFDGTSPARNSDHDPIIVGLALQSEEPALNVPDPTLVGEGPRDRLIGTDDDDVIWSAGNDVIVAGAGDDVIVFTGPGRAQAQGGPGADLFILYGPGSTPNILDFDVAEGDRLDIADTRFRAGGEVDLELLSLVRSGSSTLLQGSLDGDDVPLATLRGLDADVDLATLFGVSDDALVA